MIKLKLVTSFIILNLSCFSQTIFEKGYYIANSGKKVECLIKNIDWKNNPTEFTYKFSENTQEQQLTITTIQEFGIYNISRYVRFTIRIDRSSQNIRLLSTERQPQFNEEQLLLKVLIEGDASLYQYEEQGLIRYFYSKNGLNTEQLVYKKYKTTSNEISTNNSYKQQLRLELVCSDISTNTFNSVSYTKKSLVNLFVKYYECANSAFVQYGKKVGKNYFNLSIRPGVNLSSLNIRNSANGRNVDFGSKITLRIGLEAEFILPFNNNKWAIIIEPTYNYYNAEGEMVYLQTAGSTLTTNVVVNYKSIEVPFGLRYYIYLQNKAAIFVNASILWDFPIANSSITGERSDIIDLEIRSKPNFVFGVGYQLMDKFNVEFRFGNFRQILNRQGPWDGRYSTLSLILGYKVF